MDYVNLGPTGLKVSRLCLGTMSYGDPKWRDWVLPEEAALPHFKKALEGGINFFDTADVYSNGVSEIITGKALREMARREEVIVATKAYNAMGPGPNERGLSRKHVMHAIDASLKRLQMDYVDLYQIHRFDPTTPIEETMEALHDVVKAGKALHIGASSMFAWQFAQMQHVAERRGWTKFVTMQNHYNLAYREEEREMLAYCRASGVGVIPWSPLARGFLAGNRRRQDWGETTRAKSDEQARGYYYSDADFAIADAAADIAAKRGVSHAQVAYAWVAAQPAITAPIIGVTKLPQLDEALASTKLKLTDAEKKALEAPYRPKAVMGHV
jgi:aryl-alcohol dehydrogenase (NADP+)